MDSPARPSGADGPPNTISVAELLARYAGLPGACESSQAGYGHPEAVSVAALLRREGRGPHAAPGKLRPRGHTRLPFEPEAAPPRRFRKAAVAACALFAVGAVVGPSVLHDAILTPRADAGQRAHTEASRYAAGHERASTGSRRQRGLPQISLVSSTSGPFQQPAEPVLPRPRKAGPNAPDSDRVRAAGQGAQPAAGNAPRHAGPPGQSTPPGLIDNPGRGAHRTSTPPGQAAKSAKTVPPGQAKKATTSDTTSTAADKPGKEEPPGQAGKATKQSGTAKAGRTETSSSSNGKQKENQSGKKAEKPAKRSDATSGGSADASGVKDSKERAAKASSDSPKSAPKQPKPKALGQAG